MRKTRDLKGTLFVISGPSGSGKTTLRDQLLETGLLKKTLVKSVSYTTRPKRLVEKNRGDYFFITEERFKQERKAKKLLEWTKYLGYYYATPRHFLEKQLKQGKHVVLCLDLRGALSIKRLYPKNTVTIFIIPPSLATLQERIRRRCNSTHKNEIRERLRLAKTELSASSKYDYCVTNNNLQQAVRELKGIVLNQIKTRSLN